MIDLDGTESKQELASTALEIGSQMIVDLLPEILDGSVAALPQDHSQASYDQKITKQAGELDFNKSAEQLEREIRAYAEWPKSRTKIGATEVIITAAHAVPSNSPGAEPGDWDTDSDIGLLTIETSNGYLCVERLKPAGKGEMGSGEFIRGYLKT